MDEMFGYLGAIFLALTVERGLLTCTHSNLV